MLQTRRQFLEITAVGGGNGECDAPSDLAVLRIDGGRREVHGGPGLDPRPGEGGGDAASAQAGLPDAVREQLKALIIEELSQLMGGTSSRLVFTKQTPNVVMMVGLQGSGKTTSTGLVGVGPGLLRTGRGQPVRTWIG